MKQIFLIEKIWISDIAHTESEAYGYEIIGAVETIEESQYYINSAMKLYDVNDCWAIKSVLPEYRVKIIPILKNGDE